MVQHGLLCHIRCGNILNLPLAHPVWTTMETYETPYKVRKNNVDAVIRGHSIFFLSRGNVETR